MSEQVLTVRSMQDRAGPALREGGRGQIEADSQDPVKSSLVFALGAP
jgi:hypothetical protein